MIILKVLAACWAVMILGGVISDYIFPRIPFLERMIDDLPLVRDEPAIGGRKDDYNV